MWQKAQGARGIQWKKEPRDPLQRVVKVKQGKAKEESENKGHFLESQDDSSNYHEDVALIEPGNY